MRGKLAKTLRRAAGVKRPTEYEKPEIHHLAEMPVYETHKRVIRELGPIVRGESPNYKLRGGVETDRRIGGQTRFVVAREVEKIRYGKDGRTPLSPLIDTVRDPKTDELKHKPRTMLIPIAKPARVKAGTGRRVYQRLKRLHYRVGLDALMREVEAGAVQPQ